MFWHHLVISRKKHSCIPFPPDPVPGLRFTSSYQGAAPAPELEESKPEEKELPPWTNEPTNIDSLQDRYNLEAKISGRLPGTTLFVVDSKDRSGKVEACPCLEVSFTSFFSSLGFRLGMF